MNSDSAMWGGRFASSPSELFKQFNDSLAFDWRLLMQDIQGSICWAVALGDAGMLTHDEVESIKAALKQIASDCAHLPEPPCDADAEDVHTWVELQLVKAVGSLGKKLHTGRSRNDQVATDLRLWTRQAINARIEELHDAQRALVRLAQRAGSTPLPAYTHLQRAQPVLFAHWAMSFVEMFRRDAQRLQDALKRVNVCPLGCAALAGTAYPIDREALAVSLGFDGPSLNSMDGVSDRDFVVETLGALALSAVHLSRLAEDLILYSTSEFAFVELSDQVTSGSSIMPQKKNPDALELIRGKCGRIATAQMTMLMTLKGLPSAYNKDLQEDKQPLFDAMDQASMCLRILVQVLDGMTLNASRLHATALDGYANATELADYLARKGVPFRDAHAVVGQVVRHAIEHDLPIHELPFESLKEFHASIDSDVFDALTLEAALARRDATGGCAPAQVAAMITAAAARLADSSCSAPLQGAMVQGVGQ